MKTRLARSTPPGRFAGPQVPPLDDGPSLEMAKEPAGDPHLQPVASRAVSAYSRFPAPGKPPPAGSLEAAGARHSFSIGVWNPPITGTPASRISPGKVIRLENKVTRTAIGTEQRPSSSSSSRPRLPFDLTFERNSSVRHGALAAYAKQLVEICLACAAVDHRPASVQSTC